MNVLTSATTSTHNKAFLVISEHAFKLLRNVMDMSIHIKFYKEHPGVAQIYLFKLLEKFRYMFLSYALIMAA